MIHRSKIVLILFVAFILCPVPSPGKAAVNDSLAKITGTVYEIVRQEQEVRVPVENAFVSISTGSDSLVTATDPTGWFSFIGVRSGRFRVSVRKLGYKEYGGIMEVSEGANVLLVRLWKQSIRLSSAIISEESSPVVHRGDTIIFVGSAVRTSPEDNALDILSQMPGVTIDKGRITVNGEPVKRTYVNGRLIFGDNSMTPLVSILASDVVNIKSYEEKSIEDRRLGLVHGRKERVLDIKTKEPIVTAFDGHAMLSGGADTHKNEYGKIQGRYGAGVAANFFSEKFLAYLTANANNLQKQSFRQDEYLHSEGALRNYTENVGISAGAEKYWGDRLLGNNVKVSYSYDHECRSDRSGSMADWFSEGGEVFRSEKSTRQSLSSHGEHRIFVTSNLFSSVAGNFYAELDFRTTGSRNSSTTENSVVPPQGAAMLQNLTDVLRMRDFRTYDRLSWTGNKTDRGWLPSASFSLTAFNENGRNAQADTLPTSVIFRHLTADLSHKGVHARADLSLGRLLANDTGKTSSLTVSLSADLGKDGNLRESVNISPEGVLSPNSANSYDYSFADVTLTPLVEYRYAVQKLDLTARLTSGFIGRKDDERVPVSAGSSKWYFVPSGSFAIKAGNMEASASCRFNAPTAVQFREWIDDRNPLFLTTGNSSIRTDKHLSLTGRYVFPKVGRYGSLYLNGNCTMVLDPIVSKMEYFSADTPLPGWGLAREGAVLLSYQNARFNYTGNLSAQWQQRFQKIRTTLTLTAGTSFQGGQGYVGTGEVDMVGVSPNLDLKLDIRPTRKLSVYFKEFTSVDLVSTVGGETLSRSLSSRMKANLQYRFAGDWFVKSFYTWSSICFFKDTGTDASFHILDLVVGRSFLNGRLGISLSLNDLLNSSSSFKTVVNPGFRREELTPFSGRYLLLNLSFRLNRKNPSTEFRGTLQEGGEMMPSDIKYM